MMMISFSQVIYLLLFVFDRCSFGAAVDTCVDPEVFVVAIWNNFILFITTGLIIVKEKVAARSVNNEKPPLSSLQTALVNSRKKPTICSLVLNAFTTKNKPLNLKMRIESDPHLKKRIDTLKSIRIQVNFTIKMRFDSLRLQQYEDSIGLQNHGPQILRFFLGKYKEQILPLFFEKKNDLLLPRHLVSEICLLHYENKNELLLPRNLVSETGLLQYQTCELPNQGPRFIEADNHHRDPIFNFFWLYFVGVIGVIKMLMKVFSKFWIPKHPHQFFADTSSKTEEISSTIHVILVGIIVFSKILLGYLMKVFSKPFGTASTETEERSSTIHELTAKFANLSLEETVSQAPTLSSIVNE